MSRHLPCDAACHLFQAEICGRCQKRCNFEVLAVVECCHCRRMDDGTSVAARERVDGTLDFVCVSTLDDGIETTKQKIKVVHCALIRILILKNMFGKIIF